VPGPSVIAIGDECSFLGLRGQADVRGGEVAEVAYFEYPLRKEGYVGGTVGRVREGVF
jgi:hypothetical protein